jgi:hypothetical protein
MIIAVGMIEICLLYLDSINLMQTTSDYNWILTWPPLQNILMYPTFLYEI